MNFYLIILYYLFVTNNVLNGIKVLNSKLAEHALKRMKQFTYDTPYYLNLSHGNWTKIERNAFKTMWKFIHLDLSYNLLEKIEDATFAPINLLLQLNLNHNRLETFNPNSHHHDNFKHIKWLDLRNNQLKKISFPQKENLRYLFLSGNENVWFDISKFKKKNRTALLLDGTKCWCIWRYDMNEFDNNITEGDCNRRELSAIKPTSTDIIKDEGILTRRNVLMEYPEYMYALDIHLENRRLNEIEPDVFNNFYDAIMINLANNILTYLHRDSFIHCHNLFEINLSHNRLKDLHVDIFLKQMTSLRRIYLSFNLFQTPPLIELLELKLEYLRLNNNPIISIDYLTVFEHFKICNGNWSKLNSYCDWSYMRPIVLGDCEEISGFTCKPVTTTVTTVTPESTKLMTKASTEVIAISTKVIPSKKFVTTEETPQSKEFPLIFYLRLIILFFTLIFLICLIRFQFRLKNREAPVLSVIMEKSRVRKKRYLPGAKQPPKITTTVD